MKHKILIIDDSIVNINALYVMLRGDYQLHVAKNGQEGIKQAEENQPSLILLDILMPEMNGFEVLNILMKNPRTKSIPVMFITSLKDDENEEKGLRLGAVDYITKPFNPSIVKAKVRNHIELFAYRKTIENIAMLDGLTAVPNRRSYNEKLVEYWNKALLKKIPISIAIIDIDCFKEYNDNYGHLQGDIVLKRVAAGLKQSLPEKNGFVARYGGEEFSVILIGYKKEDAYQIVESMRENIRDLRIEHRYNRADKFVTISAGGDTIVPSDCEMEKFVDNVDKRLYRAKSLGRNQTVWNDTGDMKGQIEAFLFDHLRLLSTEGNITLNSQTDSQQILLLVYLMTHRFKHYKKENLIHAVWPNGEEKDKDYEIKEVLAGLKDKLSMLKLSYLHDLIVVIDGTYHWNNTYMCIVDSDLFQNLYLQAAKEKDKEKLYKVCERAVELYKNDFLMDLKGVQWIDDLRKWYQNMYFEMVCKLLGLYSEKKQYVKMIELCQRLLFAERFDDRIHCYYLKALIQLKRNKEALEHFEYIVEAHYSMLGVTPPEELMKLYLEIVETTKERTCKIDQVETLLKEDDVAEGAFYCDLHVFKKIYQLLARAMVREGNKTYLSILSIDDKQYLSEEQLHNLMEELQQSIKQSLRIEDVFCKISEFQYAVLLSTNSYESACSTSQRVVNQFYREHEDEIMLTFEVNAVEQADVIQLQEKKALRTS